MDLELMKAAVTLEGVLSGTSALELFAEVGRLTALCDEYRGEIERVKYWDSIVCPRCHGVGEITAVSGQTPENYSEENIPCPDCVGPIIDERDAAVSALTRARAEGMEDAAKIADAFVRFDFNQVTIATAIRTAACRLAEQANKGEK